MKTHILTGFVFLLLAMSLFGDDNEKLRAALTGLESADQVLISGAFPGAGDEGPIVLNAYGEGVAAARIYEELLKLSWSQLEKNPFERGGLSSFVGYDVVLGKGQRRAILSFTGPYVFRLRTDGGEFWFDGTGGGRLDGALTALLAEGESKKSGWKLINRRPLY